MEKMIKDMLSRKIEHFDLRKFLVIQNKIFAITMSNIFAAKTPIT
jgi:hypothetical protein